MVLRHTASGVNRGHPNLVRILGYCRQPQALVYEWMAGGDLGALLKSPEKLARLALRGRVKIVLDIALGLDALHSSFWLPIRHQDIKPANVLLDEGKYGSTAKLGDYGVAKLGDCGVARFHYPPEVHFSSN